MEAWMEAELREKRWDEKTANLPTCARCDLKILDPQLLYIPEHDEYYCMDCVKSMIEINEAAEVEE